MGRFEVYVHTQRLGADAAGGSMIIIYYLNEFILGTPMGHSSNTCTANLF